MDSAFPQRYCSRGKIEKFAEPCLLQLLSEKPAHGYELMERLAEFGLDTRVRDPGQVYRTLRSLEKEGLVVSHWEPGQSGPARRYYRLTRQGSDALRGWTEALKERVVVIQKLLERYRQFHKEEAP